MWSMRGGDEEHSSSLRDEMATGHSVSALMSSPVTITLAPHLTHSSNREMRMVLFVSEVPVSLARYVTNVGDSGKQESDCLSMIPL